MIQRYIIYSAGRCGSHGILEYFLKHGYESLHIKEDDTFWYEKDFVEIPRLTAHYHGLTWVPKDIKFWNLIINYRRDFFSQFCSRKIAEKTGQYTNYDNLKKFHQVRVDLDEAVYTVKKYYDYLEAVRIIATENSWKSVIEIAYEDFVPDSNNLFKLLPLSEKFDASSKFWMQKSPYDVTRKIYNFEKKRKLFLFKFFQKYGIKLENSRHNRSDLFH